QGDRVLAHVVVENRLVGHLFPGMETPQRYAWIELRALGADGKLVAATDPPPLGLVGSESPLVFRLQDKRDFRVLEDTTVGPRERRKRRGRTSRRRSRRAPCRRCGGRGKPRSGGRPRRGRRGRGRGRRARGARSGCRRGRGGTTRRRRRRTPRPAPAAGRAR